MCLMIACTIYLAWGLGGRWQFVLQLRAVKLGGMLLVGASIAVATILFQTVCRNRLLTPQIMGFDALYTLMQTTLIVTFGLAGYAGLPIGAKFGLEVAVMMAVSVILFGTLLGRRTQDMPRLVLTGVILGVLFRSLSGFMARVMDPNAYSVVQSVSFASFSRVQSDLLPVAAVLCVTAIVAAFWLARQLDVLALGRPIAISLGLAHDRIVLLALMIVAVLVSVATALIGPVAFFGLLISGLAHEASRDTRHANLLPMGIVIAALMLVIGQTVFERFLGLQSTLWVVIEFAGGSFFLWLLLKGRKL
jgi:iron complex transport system permease protein